MSEMGCKYGQQAIGLDNVILENPRDIYSSQMLKKIWQN